MHISQNSPFDVLFEIKSRKSNLDISKFLKFSFILFKLALIYPIILSFILIGKKDFWNL